MADPPTPQNRDGLDVIETGNEGSVFTVTETDELQQLVVLSLDLK